MLPLLLLDQKGRQVTEHFFTVLSELSFFSFSEKRRSCAYRYQPCFDLVFFPQIFENCLFQIRSFSSWDNSWHFYIGFKSCSSASINNEHCVSQTVQQVQQVHISYCYLISFELRQNDCLEIRRLKTTLWLWYACGGWRNIKIEWPLVTS